MASTIQNADATKFRGNRKETISSSNINARAMGYARGIIRGFRPVPNASARTLTLEPDPLLGDSVANVTPVDLADLGDGYTQIYREIADVDLDLTAFPSTTIFVGLDANYSISVGTTTPRWRAYSQAEIDDGTADESIIFCSVDVPATAIALVAADIDESERDEPWMWVSARGASDIPLITPGTDDEFKLWTFESLSASGSLLLDTTNKKRGNASLLLDVNDGGAVTNQFGPEEVYNVVPGELLFVKFWYRTSASVNFSTNPTFVAEFYAAGSSLGTETISISTSPETSFILVQDQLIVPASSRQVRFYFDVQTNGVTDFYVDSAQVYLRRQDSDAGGWLEDTERGLGKYVGVSSLFHRHIEDDSTDPPFIWKRPSATELSLTKGGSILSTRDVLIGGSGNLMALGINVAANPVSTLHISRNSVDASSAMSMLTIERTTSGTPADGIGGTIDFKSEGSSGLLVSGKILSVISDVTAGEETNLQFAVMGSGTLSEKMRLESTGLGVGNFSGADTVDTLLHLRAVSSDVAKIRMELDDLTIDVGNVYGRIEWEGQDTQEAGIRGSIRGEAETVNGAMALVFATGPAAAVVEDRLKITNMGFMVIAESFVDFDTTDTTDYGHDIGSDSLGLIIQANNQNNSNFISLYNSNTTGKDSLNEVRFYREDSGQSPTLSRVGSLRFKHEGTPSNYLGQFDLLLNADVGATTVSSMLNITGSNGYATFGTGQNSSANVTGINLARSAAAGNMHDDLTFTFDNLNAATTNTNFPLGMISWHGNFLGRVGESARVRVIANGSTGATTMDFQVSTTGPTLAQVLHLEPTGVLVASSGALANASVALEIASTTQGFVLPRMDSTAEGNIVSPIAGMLIYNTTSNLVRFYNGSSWGNI